MYAWVIYNTEPVSSNHILSLSAAAAVACLVATTFLATSTDVVVDIHTKYTLGIGLMHAENTVSPGAGEINFFD
jgi:hypothetical protein